MMSTSVHHSQTERPARPVDGRLYFHGVLVDGSDEYEECFLVSCSSMVAVAVPIPFPVNDLPHARRSRRQ
jgi:hypothetical protein